MNVRTFLVFISIIFPFIFFFMTFSFSFAAYLPFVGGTLICFSSITSAFFHLIFLRVHRLILRFANATFCSFSFLDKFIYVIWNWIRLYSMFFS